MLTTNLLISLFISASIAASSPLVSASVDISADSLAETVNDIGINVPKVPFYSQFSDIQSAKWQKLGCGIASLAMLIDFYHPGIVSVDTLLKEGIAAGAFINNAGWSHEGLKLLAQKYDLKSARYDLAYLDADAAFGRFEKILKDGPVIASVHYGFDPKSTIPHLVVINSIASTTIYYNDPAEKSGNGEISIEKFMKAWKKRFIVVRA